MLITRYKYFFFLSTLALLMFSVLALPVQAGEYGEQNLAWGSRGTVVSNLQLDLTKLGFNTYGVDGIFGVNTYNAVVNFQKSRSLAADGIVGPQTKAALNTFGGTVSRSAQTDTRKYPKISKVNGIYGQFHYRDLSGGRIEVDPVWVSQNIVTITLPGLNRKVQVHKYAADNFIKAFNYIKNGTATINGKQVPLLSLIKTMDGTYVTRHVNWNPAKGLSNHSWGTAIDINAADHFRYVNPAWEPNDPNLILWEKAFKPAGFSWGNSYSDAMHYELLK